MTDGQWLFILFLVLYLVESLRLQPKSAWLLTSSDRLSRPFLPLDFFGRHLMLLPILPPLQTFANLRSWELIPCPTGLEVIDPQNFRHQVLPWETLQPTLDNTKLILSAEHHLHCVNHTSAAALLERTLRWKSLSQAEREKDFLKLAAKSLDHVALCLGLTQISSQTRHLRLIGTLIFITCFGVMTVVYRRYGDGLEILIAAAILFTLQWIQAIVFWRSSGRLMTPIKHRFWKALACAFLPQHAMRAADHLCEALSPEAHPLAAASNLKETAKLCLARSFGKIIRHTSAESAGLQQQAFADYLKAQKISEDQLLETPEKQPGSVAYCPHCSAQFRDPLARCKDCGDLELKAF